MRLSPFMINCEPATGAHESQLRGHSQRLYRLTLGSQGPQLGRDRPPVPAGSNASFAALRGTGRLAAGQQQVVRRFQDHEEVVVPTDVSKAPFAVLDRRSAAQRRRQEAEEAKQRAAMAAKVQYMSPTAAGAATPTMDEESKHATSRDLLKRSTPASARLKPYDSALQTGHGATHSSLPSVHLPDIKYT